jgi:predicted DNA-binding transcriptional regulator YafY
MVSIYEAKHLHRQVLITDRIKAMNESIYYNVDMLHEAINADRQIRFQYFQWTVSKKQELRRNGAWYQISPWCLMWDDENYYLVAFDGLKIKHYRVDKIIRLSISDIPREGKQQFREFNAAKYTKSLFGMYGGEMVHVTLEGQNHMVGVLIDRFGKDISIIPLDSEHFRAHVDVITSPHFFGWVTSLGDGIRITGPDTVLEEMKSVARRISDTYL